MKTIEKIEVDGKQPFTISVTETIDSLRVEMVRELLGCDWENFSLSCEAVEILLKKTNGQSPEKTP